METEKTTTKKEVIQFQNEHCRQVETRNSEKKRMTANGQPQWEGLFLLNLGHEAKSCAEISEMPECCPVGGVHTQHAEDPWIHTRGA